MKINRQYLAGIFDAEGYVGITLPNRGVILEASLCQNDSLITRDFFYGLKEVFGGRITVRYQGHINLAYRLTGLQAYVFLGFIQDYTKIKKDQITIALTWYDERPARSKKSYTSFLSEEDRNKDIEVVEELKRLKVGSPLQENPNTFLETRPNLDYLAGFFDGDGTLGVYTHISRGRPAVRLSAGLAQVPYLYVWQLFNGLVKDFGGTITFVSKNKSLIQYRIFDDAAFVFLSVLQDYLLFKKEQARIAVEWQEAKVLTEPFQSISTEQEDRNVVTMQALRVLKQGVTEPIVA